MKNYNMNQIMLDIPTAYEPSKNHVAHYINELVESMNTNIFYKTGRPVEYDPRLMMKLVLFAYTRGIRSGRRIEEFAQENIVAMWLTQEAVPSYRTINRFRISDLSEKMINSAFSEFTKLLHERGYIDDVTYIDGTKILADANKFSFIWKKNTIRFDEMNQEKVQQLVADIKVEQESIKLPEYTNLSMEDLDDVIAHLESYLAEQENKIAKTPKVSPNPAKQARRTTKKNLRKAKHILNKNVEYKAQLDIYGERNSYSKTDTDATFMRVKEDYMQNGQLKPGYNLQIATNNQFTLDYSIFQNPTDTRTLIPFVKQLKQNGTLGKVIVADAGYGSESNYRILEDDFPSQTVLIPYGTMLKENSKKWQTDDRKVMNWEYHDKDDYYVNPSGVRFNYKRLSTRTDKYDFVRDFKQYEAEVLSNNAEPIAAAYTPGGNVKRITVNPAWEYHKAKIREQLSQPENKRIYAQRKIDVESVFGRLKAYFGFTRFSVRGIERVTREVGIALMAMNMMKLAKI